MEAYIIDGIRTPIGNYQGALSTLRADDLAALVIAEIVKRNPKIPQEAYDDVILGCANQAGEDNRNVARMASLLAGLPVTVPGDRKSTRLNSSHVRISYAVFCLKKKNIDELVNALRRLTGRLAGEPAGPDAAAMAAPMPPALLPCIDLKTTLPRFAGSLSGLAAV